MKCIYSLFLLGWTGLTGCFAQRYEADLPNILESGYYRIELSQEMAGVSDVDFISLRIYNSQRNEVPFLVDTEQPVVNMSQFDSYDLKHHTEQDSLNVMVIENPDLLTMNSICLVLASADVRKYVSIRGSNDEKQWYMVKQNEEVSHQVVRQDDVEYLQLEFPSGNYRFYEFALTNSQHSPLKVLQVGKIENSNVYAAETLLTLPSFIQKDSSDKRTYLFFHPSGNRYLIHRLVLEVDYPADYLRKGTIKRSFYDGEFELSSRNGSTIRFNESRFYSDDTLVIENNDNPPLKIESVKAFGRNRYLYAYLEKNSNYKVLIDSKLNQKPHYDIEYFKSELSSELPVLKTADFRKIYDSPDDGARQGSWIEQPAFLWSVLVIVGLLLVFICWKLIAEMKKKE